MPGDAGYRRDVDVTAAELTPVAPDLVRASERDVDAMTTLSVVLPNSRTHRRPAYVIAASACEVTPSLVHAAPELSGTFPPRWVRGRSRRVGLRSPRSSR